MESEGLIESEIHPGPYGPNRKVYKLGARGKKRTRTMLKNSIRLILQFYDGFRRFTGGQLYEILDRLEIPTTEGRVLFTAFPRLTEKSLDTLYYISSRNGGTKLDVLGDASVVSETGLKYRALKGSISDIPAPKNRFSEIWLNGVPEREELPSAIAECKRVLLDGGILRIIAPFVFFDEPKEPDLNEFIRVTAVEFFPELGVREGNEIGAVLETSFPHCGAFKLFPGLVLFWAVKVKAIPNS
jgi:hypothetical protein